MLTVSFKFIDYSDYAYWSESRLPSSPVVYIASPTHGVKILHLQGTIPSKPSQRATWKIFFSYKATTPSENYRYLAISHAQCPPRIDQWTSQVQRWPRHG